MLKQLKSSLITLFLLAVGPAVIIAQTVCPAIVDTALAAADTLCVDTGRNQACYGHVSLEVVPQANVSDFTFEQVGDIADVSQIETLRLQPMNEADQTWGIVIMRLQANLPGTLPGQNVTFLLFGDVEITNQVPTDGSSDYAPMQAFLLRTGLGDSQCENAPHSGLMVQTPKGAGEVTFNVNGVNVGMGSTVTFHAAPDGEMIVRTIEGAAVLEAVDDVHAVVEGTQLRVPLNADLNPHQRLPHPPEPYEDGHVRALPTHLLERRIDIHPPLTHEEAAAVLDRVNSGQSICGDDPLPPCDRVPHHLVARAGKRARGQLESLHNCVFRRESHETQLAEGGDHKFCDELPPEDLPCYFIPGPDDPQLAEDETRPPCPQMPGQSLSTLLAENAPCVMRPLPGDPPLSAEETRPFCADLLPGSILDDSPCVMRPLPGDPPLSAEETRPFCPESELPPPPPPPPGG